MRTWPALLVVGADFSRPDDVVQAALVDFDVAAVEESAEGPRVFFATAQARTAAAAALAQQFPALHITAIDVPDEDWAARSQASLKAVQVGHIIVAPPWDIPSAADSTGAPGLVEPDGAHEHRRERLDRHRRGGIELMPVGVESIIEAPERERSEVEI